jgi:hypothetical protein
MHMGNDAYQCIGISQVALADRHCLAVANTLGSRIPQPLLTDYWPIGAEIPLHYTCYRTAPRDAAYTAHEAP